MSECQYRTLVGVTAMVVRHFRLTSGRGGEGGTARTINFGTRSGGHPSSSHVRKTFKGRSPPRGGVFLGWGAEKNRKGALPVPLVASRPRYRGSDANLFSGGREEKKIFLFSRYLRK